MLRLPRISWDAADLMLLSASLDYLERNSKDYSKYKLAAHLPLIVLGAPGGWALNRNIAFYGSLVATFATTRLGQAFSQLVMFPVLMTIAVISFSYGTIGEAKQSLIRL